MLESKKGSVPVGILVLGTFVLCGLTLLSFSLFTNDIEGEFGDLNHMERMNSKISKYEFYKEQGISEEEIRQSLKENSFYFTEDGFKINKTETYTRPKFTINFSDWRERELVFSVQYYKE